MGRRKRYSAEFKKEALQRANEPGVTDLDLAKQRNGPTQRIRLTFVDKLTKFKDYSGYLEYAEEETY